MKRLLLLLFFLYTFILASEQKTVLVPFSDAYPNRYCYHKPFQYNRFDSMRQWLCKGNCTIRYQKLRDADALVGTLIDNPLIAGMFDNNYNAGVMGLGFSENTVSRTNIGMDRNSIFVDCTVEISKVDTPYYLHIGIPVQRTEHKITMQESINSDERVIKGGFIQEYQPKSISSLLEWESTSSSIIKSLPGMISYLSGKGIGNRQDALFGVFTQCPMTLWALADIYLQFGYDGWQYKNTNFGYYLRGVIPTTPTLKSMWNNYFFYPTIGNVDRWEVGIGINGNHVFSDNDVSGKILYFDGYASYLFANQQMRPFDLKNGFFSRYGQVKLFDSENLIYKNRAIWANDITTQSYSIGNCFKSELVLDFVYQYYQSFINIGYSFKSQSAEQIDCNSGVVNPSLASRYVYGYAPQQYIQTPNPQLGSVYNWTCDLITPFSSMNNISKQDYSQFQNTQEVIVGVPISFENQLRKSDMNFNSGVMNLQLLNILFVGYTYERLKNDYNAIIGIKGAISATTKEYFTPSFYEITVIFELDY